MLGLFTVVIAILAAVVAVTAAGIIVVRVTRRVRQ
ncbi:hypothetical protein EDD30_1725 [Couchioplanes caeruleus]|uniref:Uncharacterized protein n=1 Tax=Couchioplanes caeruleus TaxID=56438 RepID=A0A3N1GFR5_9ACTN|nr:hypothetical protein EDD30_1725 [Couchioplanes caeruleus]